MGALPLTPQQERLWRYLRGCERSPSFAEMAAALGYSSKTPIARLIDGLEKRGFAKRMRATARSIVAVTPDQRPSLASWTDAELRNELDRRLASRNAILRVAA